MVHYSSFINISGMYDPQTLKQKTAVTNWLRSADMKNPNYFLPLVPIILAVFSV